MVSSLLKNKKRQPKPIPDWNSPLKTFTQNLRFLIKSKHRILNPISVLGAATVFVAYFWYHATICNWWSPLANQGESAMLYLLALIVLATQGARKWGLEQYFSGK